MKIVKGSYRIVFVFKNFVVKLPRIFPCKAIKSTLKLLKRGQFIRFLKLSMCGYLIGPKHLLFRGIYENRSEYIFYSRNKSDFLLPTYFSLFGLLNIQKIGRQLEFGDDERKFRAFWPQIIEITNSEAFQDGHHFSNPKNFCNDDGKLKIMDYGSSYTQEVLEKYADKIYNEFDLSRCV